MQESETRSQLCGRPCPDGSGHKLWDSLFLDSAAWTALCQPGKKKKSIICNKGKYDTRLMLQRYLFSLRPVWNHQEIQNYCNVWKILPYFCRYEYNSLHYIHYMCFPIPWWLSWQQYQGVSWHLSNVQHFPESYGGPGTAVTWQWVPPCNCAHKMRKSPFSL